MSIQTVVTDANIRINLIHAQALELLGRLDGYAFVIVDQVEEEITRSEHLSKRPSCGARSTGPGCAARR